MTADTNEDNNKEVVTCANFELLPPENSNGNDNGDSDGNGEVDIDLALVDSAVTEIKHIFIKHVESTILEVGKLLIKEFYNNNIELARNNKPTKEKSLSQVIKMLQIKGDLHPSKTWLYNSVRLVVDNSDLGENYSSGKQRMEKKQHRLPEVSKVSFQNRHAYVDTHLRQHSIQYLPLQDVFFVEEWLNKLHR